MYEFDRDVLRIGGVRASSESQQAASAQESVGHLTGGPRQAGRLMREELLAEAVAFEKLVCGKRAGTWLVETRLNAREDVWPAHTEIPTSDVISISDGPAQPARLPAMRYVSRYSARRPV